MTHYPIYLNLVNRLCLVIGGGKVAERKIQTLLEYGARVTVVSPELQPSIRQWFEEGKISYIQEPFRPDMLEGVLLVFIATNQPDVNHYITETCRSRGVLVNTVDDPPNCDFYVPALVKRQSLSLAISTEGKSPLFAARLRRKLEQLIPPEYGEFVEIMGDLRQQVKALEPDIHKRRQFYEEIMDSDILDLLLEGKRDQVEERIEECISCLQE
ncbi:MAG TPA: bifunctional precorrin-2 dehydrogenase/sirohydrochlorin ferrochelatase [Syntrophomonadaceae bacterium]|nr:bifunctional precorrin-2 dehydrogenase/sirohydrochlorin ferrochelatase [Syntrophomonadaceae bacterium]